MCVNVRNVSGWAVVVCRASCAAAGRLALKVLWLAMCAFGFAGDAAAQTLAGEPPDPTVPRVGIEAGRLMELSLAEAVRAALENNREIEVERINVQQTESELRLSREVYVPVLGVKHMYGRTLSPVAPFAFSAPFSKPVRNGFNTDVSVSQFLRTGGEYKVDVGRHSSALDPTFDAFINQDGASAAASFRQPLMRDRSIDARRRQLLVADKKRDLSESLFRRKVLDVVAQVQLAYWDLVYARSGVKVAREALDLVNKQRAQTERMIREGELAPVDLVEVQAEIHNRQENILLAEEAVTRAENALKAMLLKDNNDPAWAATIIPLNEPAPPAVEMTLESAKQTALQKRPELEQLDLKEKVVEIDTRFFRNQTLPQFDFVAAYATTRLTVVSELMPLAVTSSQIFSSGRAAAELDFKTRLNILAAQPGNPPPSRFGFDAGDPFKHLHTSRFHTFQVGVQLELPFGRRAAKEILGQRLAESSKLNAEREGMLQRIEAEVRNALQALSTAGARVKAAGAAKMAAELQLESEQRQFSRGASTNFMIVVRQNNLTAARSRELRALVAYRKAVIELRRATGESEIPEASLDVLTVTTPKGRTTN